MRQLPARTAPAGPRGIRQLPAGRNAEAVAHAQRMAAGGECGGITWLCGAAGAGKRHLLQAICARGGQSACAQGYVPLAQLAALGPGVLEGLDAAAVPVPR